MSPLEQFIDLLFAWQGTEEATWKSVWLPFKPKDSNETKFFGRATQSRDELIKMIRYYEKRGDEVYIALGSQLQADMTNKTQGSWAKANRRVANIKTHKSFFIDVDVGKADGYATFDEAWFAIDDWCALAKLPLPTFRIGSGGGVHAYWILETPIPLQFWQPLANALKNAAQEHGLKCDTQCTVDAARVLRPPETWNLKLAGQPRHVNIIGDVGKVYTYAEIEEALVAHHSSHRTINTPQQAQAAQTRFNQNFSTNTPQGQAAPVDLYTAADMGCLVIAEALDTGGANHKEPTWNQLMLACVFDIDPEGTAHAMSDQHPDYIQSGGQTVVDKLARKQQEQKDRNLGYPSCFAFSQVSPLCRSCPHLHKGISPLNLPSLKSAPTIEDADLPQGYWRKSGIVWTKIKNKKGVEIDTLVLPYQVEPKAYLRDDTKDLVMQLRIGNELQYITLPKAAQATKDRTMHELHGQGVMVDKDQQEPCWRFTVAWTTKLQGIRAQRLAPTTLGWSDDGFTYADRTYIPTGDKPAFFLDDSIIKNYRPKGSLAAWKKAFEVIKGAPALEVIVASAFAAPLVKLIGMNGLVMSAFSPDSGVGKTTALKIAQAVWGHPDYLMQINDTDNAVVKRIAEMRNLPVFYDELRAKQQLDKVAAFIFQVVQGREKQRLDSNAKAKDVNSFQTLLVACANQSLAEVMARSDRTTQAGANRVLEFQVPPIVHRRSVAEVIAIIADLNENHGEAGIFYAASLGRNRKAIISKLQSYMADVEKEFKAEPQDRFWIATIAVLLLGAALANAIGLTTFDLVAMKAFLHEVFQHQRSSREEQTTNMSSVLDVVELVQEFIRENLAKRIVVTKKFVGVGGNQAATVANISNILCDVTRLDNVIAHLGADENVIRVHAEEWDRWVEERGYSRLVVRAGLRKLPGFDRKRFTIGAGTPIGDVLKAWVYCLVIPVPSGIDVTSDPGSASPT